MDSSNGIRITGDLSLSRHREILQYDGSRDPKPENETADKLSLALGCGPLDESQGGRNAEKRSHRRANYARFAAGRGGQKGQRYLPRVRDLAAEFCSWKRRLPV